MSLRQQFLQLAYPLFRAFKQAWNRRKSLYHATVTAPESIYAYSVELINGAVLNLDTFRGKKILIVNTASNCGYTAQYAELEQLQKTYAAQLVVIGFPSNDFKNQEPASDEAIAQFCSTQYHVSFPIARKTVVRPSFNQHPVYRWLTRAEKNGWCHQAPEWNFSKYLISEDGMLLAYYPPYIAPLDRLVTGAIQKSTVTV